MYFDIILEYEQVFRSRKFHFLIIANSEKQAIVKAKKQAISITKKTVNTFMFNWHVVSVDTFKEKPTLEGYSA